ncbi:MAG: hypothetical protein ACYTGI_19085 [Planctomycetota bacterium]
MVAVLLLAIALKSRQPGASASDGAGETPTVASERPEIQVVNVPGGRDLTVRHRFAGSVSRATLVYDLDGRQLTAARRTDCRKLVEDDGTDLQEDGYTTQVELSGRIPKGASHIRLVLEDETGTTVVPVEWQ